MTRISPPTGAGFIISATPPAATSSGGSRCRRARPRRSADLATDVAGFALAPAGDRIAIWADRDMRLRRTSIAPTSPPPRRGRAAAESMIETFVRHWDTWAEPGVRSRIFTFPMVDGRPQGAGVAVAPNLVGDSPSKPFGGAEETGVERRRPHALFHVARSRPPRAQFDQHGHFRGARRRQRVRRST